MLSKPKDRRVAATLAFAGAVLPIAGLHKFYLRQQGWGVVYLLLSLSWMSNPIARIASVIEGVWYLLQSAEEFDQNFNSAHPDSNPSNVLSNRPAGELETIAVPATLSSVDPAQLGAIAEAVRQLDQLRLDGLISEYEFEQKRRQLLDRMG